MFIATLEDRVHPISILQNNNILFSGFMTVASEDPRGYWQVVPQINECLVCRNGGMSYLHSSCLRMLSLHSKIFQFEVLLLPGPYGSLVDPSIPLTL